MVTVAVSAISCGAALPAVPGKGGPKWLELTSDHFTFWTDTDPERAHELVRQIEHLRQIVVGVAFPRAPQTRRSVVIALRNDAELSAFWVNSDARAWASSAQPPLWQPMIVMSAHSDNDRFDRVAAHELTHLISYAVVHHQPRWFAEGMAQFFESMRIDYDYGTVDIGIVPEDQGQRVRRPRLASIQELFAWEHTGSMEAEAGLYSTAWALFTFLINAHQAELVHYAELLEAIQPTTTEAWHDQIARAWTEAFPSLPTADLESELRRWLLSGSHTVAHANAVMRGWSAAERALSDADVYAIRALLHGSDAEAPQSRAELAAAKASEPTNVLAYAISVGRDSLNDLSVETARAMVAAHGDDWRAFWLEAIVLQKIQGLEGDARAAADKACALIAKNAALTAPPGLCPTLAAER